MSEEKKASFKDILKKIKGSAKNLGRGGLTLTLTVIVLAAIVALNFAVSAAAKKIPLEYDMTAKKVNSIQKENRDYLKSVDEDIVIYVCGKKSDYSLYLTNNCEELYSSYANEKLFDLTVSLLDKYNNISDKITVKYVDTQSVDFTELTQRYSGETLAFGDIIVSFAAGENSRYRHLGFLDIYNRVDTTGYAAYGYALYTLEGSRLETALTSAINYVVNKETKSVLLYTGHSNNDYSARYVSLLEANNYTVEISSEPLLSSIPNTFDTVVLLAPARDFMQNEIDALSSFLENGKEYSKGVIFIADAANPALPLLYDMLAKWGIEVSSGILLETNSDALPNAEVPTALISFPTGNADFTKDQNAYVTGYNVPIKQAEPQIENVTVTVAAQTLKSVVAAPVSVNSDWKDYREEDMQNFPTVLEAALNENGKTSRIFAVSSVEFIYSDWAENSKIANKDLVLSLTDKSSGKTDTAITFIDKALSSESYTNDITNQKVIALRRVLFTLPVIIIIIGIVVYIRRRNAK